MKKYDVIILGAGASGLMCAAHLDKRLTVAIIEGNERVAKKIKISGGGKCNITNVHVDASRYDGDSELVQKTLERFSKDDLLIYLQGHGLKPVIRDGRYYFCPKSSDEIIDILLEQTKWCHLKLSHALKGVVQKDDEYIVQTNRGDFEAKNVIVATGGRSYESVGASDIGLKIAKNLGIKVKEFEPALVGMTLQREQFWMKELSGVSCNVEIYVEGKRIKESLLFAHRGISGLAVLSASLYWKKGKIAVNFLPDVDIEKLIKGSKKLLSTILPLPKRLCIALLEAIEVKDVACHQLDSHAKERLKRLQYYEFAPAGNFGFTKAEASRGGVLACEIGEGFESKSHKGLHFIGEVVDVTGELGGYNFQWAFSSGIVCAMSLNNTNYRLKG